MSKSPIPEFKNSVGIVMIPVPAGSFTMGSPESEDGHNVWERQRQVTFAHDFYLGKTPVTQAQYEAVTGTNPTHHAPLGDAPVDSVNWESADEFCRKLTQLDRAAGLLPTDWEYRLPTEAEWEYACRAGSSEPRHRPGSFLPCSRNRKPILCSALRTSFPVSYPYCEYDSCSSYGVLGSADPF